VADKGGRKCGPIDQDGDGPSISVPGQPRFGGLIAQFGCVNRFHNLRLLRRAGAGGVQQERLPSGARSQVTLEERFRYWDSTWDETIVGAVLRGC